MVSSALTSSDSSESTSSDKSLGIFIWELAASLHELNNSVLLMTQFIIDGVINTDLKSAVEVTAAHSLSAVTDPDTFIIILNDDQANEVAPEPSHTEDGQSATENLAEPPTVPGSSGISTAPNDVATCLLKWYAITVGCHLGVYQGSTEVTSNIECIPGGFTLKFDTEANAREAFDNHLHAGLIKQVEYVVSETMLRYDHFHGTQ
ncbi:hypothetical protein CPB84DRAFT_1751353 [Gymnopilus junonius]|uniref:Uncharacterized protein n=1 Tax=Gymnopilus junonius TaxID=109634 RepID=A0A9P5TIL4_GYMJU|nr:hypothetical protein CPB84DRAFT_1751353 [Gymnopilus junonius]